MGLYILESPTQKTIWGGTPIQPLEDLVGRCLLNSLASGEGWVLGPPSAYPSGGPGYPSAHDDQLQSKGPLSAAAASPVLLCGSLARLQGS